MYIKPLLGIAVFGQVHAGGDADLGQCTGSTSGECEGNEELFHLNSLGWFVVGFTCMAVGYMGRGDATGQMYSEFLFILQPVATTLSQPTGKAVSIDVRCCFLLSCANETSGWVGLGDWKCSRMGAGETG